MNRAVLAAVDEPLLARYDEPVGVEGGQLSGREVVDAFALLHVDGPVGEHDVRVEPLGPRECLEPPEEPAPHGPGHVVDRAARIDEIETPITQAPRGQPTDVPAHPARADAPGARQALGLGEPRARDVDAGHVEAALGEEDAVARPSPQPTSSTRAPGGSRALT